MHRVTVSTDINVNSQSAWAVLDDFESIYKFNPDVKNSELLSSQKTGVGAKRTCFFYDGTSLNETITDYEDGSFYEYELSEFKLPLKTAYCRWSVIPINDGACTVKASLTFTPKFGPIGWLMAKLLIKPALTKAFIGVFKGLDDHIRTGKIVCKDGSLKAA